MAESIEPKVTTNDLNKSQGDSKQVKPVAYPSKWFETHPGEKPKLNVPPVNDDQIGQLEALIRADYAERAIPVEVVIGFLYYHFTHQPGTLREDWSSFGRVIGLSGSEITLDNIMTVEETLLLPPDLPDAIPMTDQERLQYIVAICVIYRLNLATHHEQRKKIIQTVTKALALIGPLKLQINTAFFKQRGWCSNVHFRHLIAAIDMFLFEFKRGHLYAQARLGTQAARAKGCGISPSLNYISKVLSWNPPKFAEWIWIPEVLDQLYQVQSVEVSKTEETTCSQSYLWYMMEMSLSDKSPFSIGANADLHYLIHCIGVSIGAEHTERSRNAHKVGEREAGAEDALFNIAMIIAYVNVTYCQRLKRVFGPYDYEEPNDDEDVDEEGLPANANPTKWFQYYKQNNFKVPTKIKHFAAKRWAAAEASREGTIGKELSQKAAQYLES